MELSILDHAHHRNGVGGAPFKVAIVHDAELDRDMLVVMFADQYYTAAFDLELLQERDIRFGSNSWRGDHYDHALRGQLWPSEVDA